MYILSRVFVITDFFLFNVILLLICSVKQNVLYDKARIDGIELQEYQCKHFNINYMSWEMPPHNCKKEIPLSLIRPTIITYTLRASY